MLYRIVVILLIIKSSLFAVELSYGKGSFEYQFSLTQVMQCSVDMDVNVLTLRETHLPITQALFLYGFVDVYQSDKLDDYASYINKGSDFNPIGPSISDLASSMGAPVPVSFEMRGVDLSLGLGYELFKEDKSYLAIGVGSGLSMPYIETENLLEDAQLFISILDKTKTSIMTYKLMPSVQGSYQLVQGLSLEASLAYGFQYGSIENDYIRGEGDFSGTLLQSDLSLKYRPVPTEDIYKNLFVEIGYRYNDWQVEQMKVSMVDPALNYDFAQYLDVGFASHFLHFGAGYQF